MKKSRILISLATGMLLFLITGRAWAYDFQDLTQVEQWHGPTNNGSLYDVIGAQSDYNTTGANLSGNSLTIYTNWNPIKDDFRYANEGLYTADLFIDKDLDGDFDYAVQLDTLTGTGNTYNLTSYKTSYNVWSSTPRLTDLTDHYYYGGRYKDNYSASPHYSSLLQVPVIEIGTLKGTTSVVWGAGDAFASHSVTVNLSGLGLVDDWYFVWGTATCGNDAISGKVQVPEPASMLLLGLGLLGVAVARRKFSY